MRLWTPEGENDIYQPYSAGEVRSPSDFFLLADSWVDFTFNNRRQPGPGYTISQVGSVWGVDLRHGRHANAWFVDGHAAVQPADYFLDLDERQSQYMDWSPNDSLAVFEEGLQINTP